MGTTNILPFANGTGADVQSDDTYKANAPAGFVPGPAYPNQANKALRQSSAVAAAIARFVTDSSYGNQDAFNDSEDTASLASKINIAVLSLPAIISAHKYVEIFKFFLQNAAINDFTDKFADAEIYFSGVDTRRTLATNELAKTILTPKGILANPPVPEFTLIPGAIDFANVVDSGKIFQRGYRRLSNGMVEVRVGVYPDFSVRAPGWVMLGTLPSTLVPATVVESRIPGIYCADTIQVKDALGRSANAMLGVDIYGRVYMYPEAVPKSVRPTIDLDKPTPATQGVGLGTSSITVDSGRPQVLPAFKTGFEINWFRGLTGVLFDINMDDLNAKINTYNFPSGTKFAYFGSLTYMPL